MNVALVPAKPLPIAKTRLAALLTDDGRAVVGAAMLDDVLAALTAARRLDQVLVVTADRRLAERARAVGAIAVDERTPRGLNGAVALGTETALALGATTLLVVLSDVPLVSTDDVDELLDRTPARGVLLVPSKEGTGTNAIVQRPGAVIPPCFGGRSLERHVAAAERRRLSCVIWRNARLGLDVDTPADLRAVARAASTTATGAAALRLGVPNSPRPTA